MRLLDLFLNRWLYKESQDMTTKDSSYVSANPNPPPSTAVQSGSAAIDVNNNTIQINGGQLVPGSVPSSSLNLADVGWTQTCVFTSASATQVNWGAGTFTSAAGVSYAISAGNTGAMGAKTYIYLNIAVSTTTYQTTTNIVTPVGDGKVLIAVAQNAAVSATYALTQTNEIVGDNILANTIVAGKMNVTTLSSISANIGSITAGSLDAVTITGSTITGGTVRTSTGTTRVEMVGATNDLSVYDSSILRTKLASGNISFYDTGGALSGVLGAVVTVFGATTHSFITSNTSPTYAAQLSLNSISTDNASVSLHVVNTSMGTFLGQLFINATGTVTLTGSSSSSIGSAGTAFNQGYFSNVTLGGVSRSTWPSGGGDAYLANNQTFTGSNTFDNSGTGNFFNWIRTTGSNPDIGTSAAKFRNVFCTNLGSAGAKVNVYSSGLLACPLPITSSALEKISKTVHKKLEKGVGHYGDEVDYLDIPDAPPEMKKMVPQDEEEGGGEKEDIDLIKTVAFLYSCVKELNEELKLLKSK